MSLDKTIQDNGGLHPKLTETIKNINDRVLNETNKSYTAVLATTIPIKLQPNVTGEQFTATFSDQVNHQGSPSVVYFQTAGSADFIEVGDYIDGSAVVKDPQLPAGALVTAVDRANNSITISTTITTTAGTYTPIYVYKNAIDGTRLDSDLAFYTNKCILIKNQTDAKENGLYRAISLLPLILIRAEYYSNYTEIQDTNIEVSAGFENINTGFIPHVTDPYQPGIDPIIFTNNTYVRKQVAGTLSTDNVEMTMLPISASSTVYNLTKDSASFISVEGTTSQIIKAYDVLKAEGNRLHIVKNGTDFVVTIQNYSGADQIVVQPQTSATFYICQNGTSDGAFKSISSSSVDPQPFTPTKNDADKKLPMFGYLSTVSQISVNAISVTVPVSKSSAGVLYFYGDGTENQANNAVDIWNVNATTLVKGAVYEYYNDSKIDIPVKNFDGTGSLFLLKAKTYVKKTLIDNATVSGAWSTIEAPASDQTKLYGGDTTLNSSNVGNVINYFQVAAPRTATLPTGTGFEGKLLKIANATSSTSYLKCTDTVNAANNTVLQPGQSAIYERSDFGWVILSAPAVKTIQTVTVSTTPPTVAATPLTANGARLIRVLGSGRAMFVLPSAINLQIGDTFYFLNELDETIGMTNLLFSVFGFTPIADGTGDAEVVLVDNSTSAGVWHVSFKPQKYRIFGGNAGEILVLGATSDVVSSGCRISTDPTFANNSDNEVPSQRAVKAYIAASGGGGASTLASLTDVNLTATADKDMLAYDSASSKFVNKNTTAVKQNLGLDQVTNDAQLKRSAGDYASFTLKTTIDQNDVLLIEDAQDGGKKKKITVGAAIKQSFDPLDNQSTCAMATMQTAIDAGVTKASDGKRQMGTWNASTNTPTLTNPPSGGLVVGDFYEVSTAGTQFGKYWAVGDRIVVGQNADGSLMLFKSALQTSLFDAKNVWVSQTVGADSNSGTIDRPKQTVSGGYSVVAQPGTLNINSGTYTLTSFNFNKQNVNVIGGGVNGNNNTELSGGATITAARNRFKNCNITHGTSSWTISDATGSHHFEQCSFIGSAASIVFATTSRGFFTISGCDFSGTSAASNIVLNNITGAVNTLYLTNCANVRLSIGSGWVVYILACPSVQINSNAGTLVYLDIQNINAILTSQAQLTALTADTNIATDGFYICDFASPAIGANTFGKGDVFLKMSVQGIATSVTLNRPFNQCAAAVSVYNQATTSFSSYIKMNGAWSPVAGSSGGVAKLTMAQRLAVTTQQTIYNTDLGIVETYDGVNWSPNGVINLAAFQAASYTTTGLYAVNATPPTATAGAAISAGDVFWYNATNNGYYLAYKWANSPSAIYFSNGTSTFQTIFKSNSANAWYYAPTPATVDTTYEYVTLVNSTNGASPAAPYNITQGDHTLRVDNTTGAVFLKLPLVASVGIATRAKKYKIVNATLNTNTVIVSCSGTDQFYQNPSGITSYTMRPGETLMLSTIITAGGNYWNLDNMSLADQYGAMYNGGTITADTTLTKNGSVWVVSATTANITITLPPSAWGAGSTFIYRSDNNSQFNVILKAATTNPAQHTINGLTQQFLSCQQTAIVRVVDTNNIATIAQISSPTGELVPIGTMAMFFGAVAPPGWLLCDGSTFLTDVFPELRAVLGGNIVPDMRGMFPRGKNNGRADGLQDPSGERALGSYQADDLKSHTHATRVNHVNNVLTGGGSYAIQANSGDFTNGGLVGTVISSGGAETRPRNIAVNYIIKAKNTPVPAYQVAAGVDISTAIDTVNSTVTVKASKNYQASLNTETLTGDISITGAPIYRKIVPFTNIPNNTNPTLIDAVLTTTYCKSVISITGIWKENGVYLTVNAGVCVSLNFIVNAYIAAAGLAIQAGTLRNATNSGWVIVEYTKI